MYVWQQCSNTAVGRCLSAPYLAAMCHDHPLWKDVPLYQNVVGIFNKDSLYIYLFFNPTLQA